MWEILQGKVASALSPFASTTQLPNLPPHGLSYTLNLWTALQTMQTEVCVGGKGDVRAKREKKHITADFVCCNLHSSALRVWRRQFGKDSPSPPSIAAEIIET